ncbi:MAG TPA: carbohydrate ABC transporter permease [Thermomicrobiales bacterium]|nr:carbohydrate ABC transporter permease [Thermomicrobiales bacterium]
MNYAPAGRSAFQRFIWYLPALVITIIFAFPLYWILLTSVKPRALIQDYPPRFRFSPVWDNYRLVFESPYLDAIRNSVIIAVGSAVLSVALATLTAYGLSRYAFRSKDNLLFWILSLRMLPAIAVIIPYSRMVRWVNLEDTHLAMIMIYAVFNISFSVWLLKGFFDEIPRELEEAAIMDGYGPWAVFGRVALPLVIPGVATALVFSMILSLNEFMLAFVLTRTSAVTAPVALTNVFITTLGVNYGGISAAAMVLVAPVALFAILVRRHLIRGMSFGQLG